MYLYVYNRVQVPINTAAIEESDIMTVGTKMTQSTIYAIDKSSITHYCGNNCVNSANYCIVLIFFICCNSHGIRIAF